VYSVLICFSSFDKSMGEWYTPNTPLLTPSTSGNPNSMDLNLVFLPSLGWAGNDQYLRVRYCTSDDHLFGLFCLGMALHHLVPAALRPPCKTILLLCLIDLRVSACGNMIALYHGLQVFEPRSKIVHTFPAALAFPFAL